MSAVLARMIREEIARDGAMPFPRFMELALYHPEHGYYAGGRAEVGRAGDFFTNVSVGSLFGRMLAYQFAKLWEQMGKPSPFAVVEQGGHGGQFAEDVLTWLKQFSPECFAALEYCLVEPSAALTRQQKERLAHFPVRWVASLDALSPFTGVHFSNELVDAFPVHVVRWSGEAWEECCVTMEGERFVWTTCPLGSDTLSAACARIPLPLPVGYTTEVNLAADGWVSDVARKLERGAIIAFDYGYLRPDYYAPERTEGTLSAYRRHRREKDPLSDPGTKDLTAHVDFSRLMESGEEAGLRVLGFADQHHAMVGLGAAFFGEEIPPSDLRGFQTLMHPTLMGQAFKVVVFAKGEVPADLPLLQYARTRP